MKKNVRYLVVVLVCIAVLVGAVLVLALTGGEEEAASSSAGSTSSTAVEALIDRPDTELKTMEVTNEEGGYIIHAEPEAASSGTEIPTAVPSATGWAASPRVPTARAISARRAQAPYMSQPWAISSMAPIYSLFAMTC